MTESLEPNPFVVALLHRYVTSPQQRLVDVGCGPGLYRDATPGTYIGVDHASGPYGDVPRRLDVIAAADDLPFDDGSVDVVFTLSALYQFPDPDAALREFHRVLRSGGRVLVIDYNRRAQRRLSRIEGASRPGWTALGLRARVRRAGFDGTRLLVPAADQPRGVGRLVRLAREELKGQWIVVTGTRPAS